MCKIIVEATMGQSGVGEVRRSAASQVVVAKLGGTRRCRSANTTGLLLGGGELGGARQGKELGGCLSWRGPATAAGQISGTIKNSY